MRLLIQLAALTVFAITPAHAQITSPDKLVAPPPRNPADRHRAIPTDDDLQWLWSFTKPEPNGRASDLRIDPRFQAMLTRSFIQPQAMWGPPNTHESLPTVIPLFLSEHGVVTAEANRYITIDGCVPSFCPAHGLLWLDLGTANPLIVFAAVNWTTEGHTTDEAAADYNLWLFPNRILDPDELPLALTETIAHWDARLATAHRLVPHIAHALIVQPGGQPAALVPAMVGANTIAPQPAETP